MIVHMNVCMSELSWVTTSTTTTTTSVIWMVFSNQICFWEIIVFFFIPEIKCDIEINY